MGLLKHLLFWPVTGPLFLAEFSLGKVEGVVREELTDDTRIKAELMELQLKLELGDIDDEEYVRQEASLMRQLREIRHWREQFGMGVSGGPVRVQAQPPEAIPGGPAEAAEVAEVAAASPAEGAGGGGPAAGGSEAGGDASADGTAEERRPRVADAGAGADIEINLDWD
jgi:hypothetical protein